MKWIILISIFIVLLILILILNKRIKIKNINNELNIIKLKIETNLIQEADILKNYLLFFDEKKAIIITEYNHYLDYDNQNDSIYDYYEYIQKFNEEIKNVLDNKEKLISEKIIKELNNERTEIDNIINANIKLFNEINDNYKKENKKLLTKIVNKIYKYKIQDNFIKFEAKELNILKNTND